MTEVLDDILQVPCELFDFSQAKITKHFTGILEPAWEVEESR